MPDRNDIRVSYIISTRNRADFLDKAISNVREYITPEDELIVIDGSSTDHTAQIVENHRDAVTFFLSEADCGEAHGYNKGILASRGRYIKFLTDDDYSYPQAMRDAIGVMEDHPELDALICGGESFKIDAATKQQQLLTYVHLPASLNTDTDRNAIMNVGCGLGLILARKCLSLVGLLDTTFRCVDTDYISRLIASRANLRYLNIKLYRHVEYLHSGVGNRSECSRDAVRAFQRVRDWEKAIDHLGVDPRASADPWGLLKLQGGKPLWKLIWCGEQLRRNRLRVFLPLLLFPLEASARLARWCRRVRRRVGVGVATPPSPEPKWDKSLR